jgi:hypothetical protein
MEIWEYKRVMESGKRNFPYKIWQIGLEYACSKMLKTE